MDLISALESAGVVPVLKLSASADAERLCAVLDQAGLPVIEVTLRTTDALRVLERMRRAASSAIVGAGTVVSVDQVRAAAAAGAQFVVSPGIRPALLDAAGRAGIPIIPGVATASEVMLALEAGLSVLKFFPASVSGGLAWMHAMRGPFPDVRFVPTGGLSAVDIPSYLGDASVVAMAGSWIAPSELIEGGDYGRIQNLAAAASSAVQAVRPQTGRG